MAKKRDAERKARMAEMRAKSLAAKKAAAAAAAAGKFLFVITLVPIHSKFQELYPFPPLFR